MREAGKPATLAELMGKQSENSDLSLKDLPEMLGEQMPDLPKNRIGKFRLMSALAQRYGPNFRNLPMVSKIIKEFDSEIETENVIRLNKGK